MPHLEGKCYCGKPIHFPKDAQNGYIWKCHTPGCGGIWELTNKGGGQPLRKSPSKSPPKESYENRPSYSNSSGSSCLFVGIILFVGILGSGYKLFELLFS